MKSICKIVSVLVFLLINQFSFSATCSETATTNGQDDGPTSTLINTFPCTGGGAITAMTLDGNIGGSCPSWYDYDIYINGVLAFSNQCNQTGLDVTAFLPITSVELRSRDNDAWSDNINLVLTLNITYNAGPMVFSSCISTQNNTTTVVPGAIDQEVIGIEVVTTGDTGPFDVTQLRLRTNGTIDWSNDISGNIKVYYTGASSTFATTTLFGSAVPLAPGNNIDVSGIQTISNGTNYFWVAYDVTAGATIANVIDAQCTRVTMNAGVGNKTPTVTNPVGNRIIDIVYCTSNATSNGDSELDNVVLVGDINTISNNTASTCAQYTDFTGLTPAELTPAGNYQVDVTLGTCGGNYTKYGRVYIDWNIDGDFDDANEDLGEQGGVSATTTYNFNFTVPVGATVGNTTMRVICREGGTGITACGTYSYGETEDYTVTIVTPGPMSYGSCTTVQASTASVSNCSGNQEIIGVEVDMSGVLTPLDLTQFQINMTGTTNITDVSNIDIFYTGTSSTYATTNLFASTTPVGGTITINGTQTLSSGTNYFWITYDIAAGATVTNNLDARCTQITVDGTNRTPSTTNPAGNRTITACIVSPGGVSDNITAWFDANNGTDNTTDGGMISSWSNNAGNANVPTVTQTTNANKPLYRANRINWNPIVEFDGGNDYMSQAATLGSDLFDPSENTVFMMHIAKGGIVYFKWEHQDNNTNRMGFEMNGGRPRFDFPSSDAGDQTVAASSYSAVGEIVTGHTSANVSTLRMNGVVDVTNTTTGTMGTGLTREFVIGNNPTTNPLACEIDYAELILYKKSLSGAEMNRVESYMAIKYGVTLGGNGATASSYSSPYGASVWDANTGYHNDVTGIAKDMVAQVLDQPKSITLNTGSTMSFTIAHNSIASPTSLTADNTYLIVGHDNGDITNNTSVSYTHASTVIQVQLNRVFRLQTTNLPTGTSKASNELEIEIDMANVPGNAPGTGLGAANVAADLRLLLDDNTTFGQGAGNERAFTNSGVSGNLIKFKIPFSDLPANGAYFFTIGSVNGSTAPLPIKLASFNAECENNTVEVAWTTSSEINNDYFTIEKSVDGIEYEEVAIVNGAGNSSSQLSYSLVDDSPSEFVSYYRLKQTDFDGKYSYSKLVAVACELSDEIVIYPNPAKGMFSFDYFSKNGEEVIMEIYNMAGQLVLMRSYDNLPIGNSQTSVKIDNITNGVYFVMFSSVEERVTHKLSIIE